MSGSWFSVCVLLITSMATLTLQRRSNRYFDSEEVCLECPNPVRPTNILEDSQLTGKSTSLIEFEVRPCNVSGEENEDMYFRLRNINIDGVERSPEDFKINAWEDYGLCERFCQIEIFIGPSQEFPYNRTWSTDDLIWINCEYRMTNCHVHLWTCEKWSQETDEVRILQIIQETLVGKES